MGHLPDETDSMPYADIPCERFGWPHGWPSRDGDIDPRHGRRARSAGPCW